MVEIYEGKDGRFHAYVPVGTGPDGTVDRRHRTGQTHAAVLAKVRKLQAEIAAAAVAKPGRVPLLADFFGTWVDDPDAEWRYNTQTGTYSWAVKNWIIPELGRWRLDLLAENPKVIEDFFKGMARDEDEAEAAKREGRRPLGLAPSSVHTIFRILRAGLNIAVQRRLIARSPIEFMAWKPKLVEEEVTPLLVDEVKRILTVCETRRNGTRFSIAMPLGLRQGEALGTQWYQAPTSTREKPIGLDLDGGWLHTRKQTERRKWQHGCKDPRECARPRCRTTPCPTRWGHGCGKLPQECTKHRADRCPKRRPAESCRQHRDLRNCVKVCPPDCTGHADRCPKRTGGGIRLVDTKTEAGRRRAALAPQMVTKLRAHKAEQDAERRAAGEHWQDHDLVWCQLDGSPIDAGTDRREWKTILKLADVRDARIHDGRHTAATMLLLQGVDEQTVMAIMGWSDRRMVQRYQHVIDELRVEASRRLSELLYGPDEVPAPKPKKKKKGKADKQRKHKNVNIDNVDYATIPATRPGEAKIIPFQRSA
ncbi:tyrosine-type recombinase/integrase [Dactylosporangium sp. NPDC051485]|uniref:tyrosine-type recombinase/integrase n=1 Tax=Dactylosporangium sp. NPDC051485 TaxID=3154846 RepID=UPI003413137E